MMRPPVGVRQSRDEPAVTDPFHFVGVDIEHAVVMGFAVAEDVFHGRIHFPAVGLQFAVNETDAAERHDGALERFIGLESDNLFQILVNISGLVGGDGGNRFFVDVVDAFSLPFESHPVQEIPPERNGSLRGRFQKLFPAVIRSVIALDEVFDIDFFRPRALAEIHDAVSFSPVSLEEIAAAGERFSARTAEGTRFVVPGAGRKLPSRQ